MYLPWYKEKLAGDFMSELILASSSPRRREILSLVYPSFQIITKDVDETVDPKLPPVEIVMNLAERKAKGVAEEYPDAFVVGADTIVYLDGSILGKPKDAEDAEQMLSRLSGTTHSVFTGVAICYKGKVDTFYERTDVTFWELTDDEISEYIKTGEPLDKAGSYGIQGIGATLVKEIHGDYYTVVGLPIAKLYRHLKKMGFGEEKPAKLYVDERLS